LLTRPQSRTATAPASRATVAPVPVTELPGKHLSIQQQFQLFANEDDDGEVSLKVPPCPAYELTRSFASGSIAI
jgi:hypothetical protein